ncbi:MAG: efflux transporter outer membrane subunit [Planctomycetota bacterium]
MTLLFRVRQFFYGPLWHTRPRLGAGGGVLAIASFLIVLNVACQVHEPRPFADPPVAASNHWRNLKESGEGRLESWWKSFDDPTLHRLVKEAFRGNFELEQAWARLDRAQAEWQRAGAPSLPSLDLQNSFSLSRFVDEDIGSSGGGFQIEPIDERSAGYSIGPRVNWEIDLWKRIENSQAAANYRFDATVDDLQATALLLTAQIADSWFVFREQKALLSLLFEQLDSSRDLLELTELRFSLGQGTALDVLQQRSQVASVEAQAPAVRRNREIARNRLSVLLGRAPVDLNLGAVPDERIPFAGLPQFPNIGSPAELIRRRPDLRAARSRLRAADREIAVAIAEKLPRLDFSISYAFSAARGSGLFDQEVGSVLASILTPLFDGGRRDAVLRQREAEVRESLAQYAQSYLLALREIEDALVRENEQKNRLKILDRQLDLATKNLREARSRYQNGLVDFLSVLNAVGSLQTLQRTQISERRVLWGARSELYSALGGLDLEGLEARPLSPRLGAQMEDE